MRLKLTNMKFILGEKKEMSQIFDENGKVSPVTLIKAGPIYITQIKTKEKDGYRALQVGFGERKLKNIKKPQRGHLEKSQVSNQKSKNSGARYMREFRAEEDELNKYNLGDEITIDVFQEGDNIEVSGVSKGKGFQGVVKRHGFHGGSRTHGQKHSEREPGSIGSVWPQRVLKGKRMAGRMGSDRITVKGLKIIKIDKDNNILAINGAIPGHRGTLLEIKVK